MEINLLNPLRREEQVIKLGYIKEGKSYNRRIQKFALSFSPYCSPDYHLTLLCDYGIFIFRKDRLNMVQGPWNVLIQHFENGIEYLEGLVIRVSYHDIINYQDQFYVVTDAGGILAINDDVGEEGSEHQNVRVVVPGDVIVYTEVRGFKYVLDKKLYLVESDGDLLVVLRSRQDQTTPGFRVYKVDLPSNGRHWRESEVKDLGSRALVLGNNTSFSTETSDSYYAVKRNCIYFTADLAFGNEKGRDMGLFHMEYGKIESFRGKTNYFLRAQLWIQPRF